MPKEPKGLIQFQLLRLLAVPFGVVVAWIMYFLPSNNPDLREEIAVLLAFTVGGVIALFAGRRIVGN